MRPHARPPHAAQPPSCSHTCTLELGYKREVEAGVQGNWAAVGLYPPMGARVHIGHGATAQQQQHLRLCASMIARVPPPHWVRWQGTPRYKTSSYLKGTAATCMESAHETHTVQRGGAAKGNAGTLAPGTASNSALALLCRRRGGDAPIAHATTGGPAGPTGATGK